MSSENIKLYVIAQLLFVQTDSKHMSYESESLSLSDATSERLRHITDYHLSSVHVKAPGLCLTLDETQTTSLSL